MLLTIDIGNSSTALGAFGSDDAPIASWRLPTGRQSRPGDTQASSLGALAERADTACKTLKTLPCAAWSGR